MELREYQRRSIDDLYAWFGENKTGNPCLVLPTGSGKSHVIAALCKEALQSWPSTKILMLTHQKELIEQNAEKLLLHWPTAPIGIYSASVGSRKFDSITYAGIGSVYSRAKDIGVVDLIIIDEAHRVNHRAEGMYRRLLADLQTINPRLRVIGLTATPWRLGHGLIIDDPSIFTHLIEPVSIEELVDCGYLSTLRSKRTDTVFDTKKIKVRAGDFVEKDMDAAFNDDDTNLAVTREIIARSGDCKSWLIFCISVSHAMQIAKMLNDHNVESECVHGETPKAERERILSDFKDGKIRALTNCNVLTTGFDNPKIDLIAMLRPTMSPSLYSQMAGRGMRISEGKDACLVFDFAGNVFRHGPVTHIAPPKKKGEGEGEAPAKTCPECAEIVHAAAKVCPACGYVFPIKEKPIQELQDDDIMRVEGRKMNVSKWVWDDPTSKANGIKMLRVRYYGDKLSSPVISEYFCLNHGGYAARKASAKLAGIIRNTGIASVASVDDLNAAMPPASLVYEKSGNFFNVLSLNWERSQ